MTYQERLLMEHIIRLEIQKEELIEIELRQIRMDLMMLRFNLLHLDILTDLLLRIEP